MSEPMSEERLAELRANVERAEENTKWYGPLGYAGEMERDCLNEIDRLRAENERLESWVSDLQSGMYVNCVYCGHRYGPGETTPVSMADALKAHVEQCPKHPMSALKAEVERLHQSVAGERMFKESERQWKEWANEAGAKVTQELEVMKTEVERLRGVLRDIAYNTSTSIPFAAPPETYIVGQLHSCIGRAARALNPEPSA